VSAATQSHRQQLVHREGKLRARTCSRDGSQGGRNRDRARLEPDLGANQGQITSKPWVNSMGETQVTTRSNRREEPVSDKGTNTCGFIGPGLNRISDGARQGNAAISDQQSSAHCCVAALTATEEQHFPISAVSKELRANRVRSCD